MVVLKTKKYIKHKKERSKRIKKSKKYKKIQKYKRSKKNQKYKRSKKYKGGDVGSYDTSFLRCYDENLIKIQTAIEKNSGKHRIDREISEIFINSQISPIIRQAAADLVNNTIYITLEEVTNIIERLVIQLYTENDLNSYEKIFLNTGAINKSSYFLCVLALFYIRKHGFKEPTHFVESFDHNIFDEAGDNPVIIIDDSSYSGSQLSSVLNFIYTSRIKINKVPKIYSLLIALNKFSLLKLSLIPIETPKYHLIVSPFKLIYLPEYLYEPLIYTLGIERYIYLTCIFSTFSAVDYLPNVSMYFDHKLADEVSTFSKTLLYGQIIPNYFHEKLKYMIENDSLLFRRIINNDILDDTSSEKIIELLNDYNDSSGKKFKNVLKISNISDISDMSFDIINKLSNEIPDRPGTQYIQFKPFINTCNTSELLIQNIEDEEIINFDYFLFITPDKCLEFPRDCSVNNNYLGYVDSCTSLLFKAISQDDIDMMKKIRKNYIGPSPEKIAQDQEKEAQSKILLDNAIRISKKINNYKCPTSWYKKGEFAMTCISNL
jgi:hypothetical protein